MLTRLRRQGRRALRRERLFRDRVNPLDKFDDVELLRKFRFRRADIMGIVDEVKLETSFNMFLSTRDTDTFARFACGELLNVSQPTASRTITRVTNALRQTAGRWIKLVRPATVSPTPDTVVAIKSHTSFFFLLLTSVPKEESNIRLLSATPSSKVMISV